MKVVYFDVGWEDGNWNEVSRGNDFIRSPFWWDGYIGGESGVQPKLYKYKFDMSTDFLKQPLEINTGLGLGNHLVGVDKNGWLYFEKALASEYALARYGIQSGDKQFAVVSEETASNIIQASVSPDGIIYLISYDRINQSVQPKMIRCSFPDQRITSSARRDPRSPFYSYSSQFHFILRAQVETSESFKDSEVLFNSL